MIRYKWFVWVPAVYARAVYPVGMHCRFDLPGLHDRPPTWWQRLCVWVLFRTRLGRLCWHTVHTYSQPGMGDPDRHSFRDEMTARSV